MQSACLAEEATGAEELLLTRLQESGFEAIEFPDNSVRFGGLLERLDGVEISLVRGIVALSGRPSLKLLTRSVTWLGNGWMYPLVAILVVCLEPRHAVRLMLAGGLSATICFILYPQIKKRVARLRPFCVDPSIQATSKPLDYYSFPSGHSMAATAVAVPLAVGVPHGLLVISLSWLLIAWSRLSSGHHFPTDVIFGAVIGVVVSLPIALLLL